MLVVGTPVDEHLNPDPKFVRLAVEGLLDQLRDGQHVILRSTVYPRVTAMVEKLIAAAGRDDRRVVLPRADRRGQGARGAALAPADRVGAHRARGAARRRALRHDRAVDRAPRRRGGRAREALRQHVALHPVRGREPAVHDRQRLRARLRPHPRRAQAGLPAAGRHAGAGSRGRTVPVEGHDAARGVQQQQLHARSREHDDQRGPPALHGLQARAASTTCRR